MPFNGSGGFVPLPAPDYPAVAGTTIVADHYNNVQQDVFDGLGNCITRDGQSPATANIPMGGFKLTGVGAPTVVGDVLTWGNAAQVSTLTVQATSGATTMLVKAGASQFARTCYGGNNVDPVAAGVHVFQDSTGIGGLANQSNNALRFATNATDRMLIAANGRVGIGTNTPTQTLDVNGTALFSGPVYLQPGTSGSTEATRAINDAAFHSFYNTANTLRTGAIVGYVADRITVVLENANLFSVSKGASSFTWSPVGLAPSDNGVQTLGANAARWSTVYATQGEFTNGVNKVKGTPINGGNLAAGELFVTAGTITFGAPGTAGDVYYAFNNSGSSVTVVQGGGLTMRLAGTTATGNRTLLPYGILSGVYIDSNTIVISGSGLV